MKNKYKYVGQIIIACFVVYIGYKLYEPYYEIKKSQEWLAESERENPTPKTTNYTNDQIAIAAQLFVKDKLKSPSTADFEPLFKSVVKKNGSIYTVTGKVDSQNGFGALITSTYSVRINVKEEGGVSLLAIDVYE